MKILAVTDIHGAYEVVEDIARHEEPDLMIIGGDLTNVGSVGEASGAIDRFSAIVEDVLAVAGNMDTPEIDAMLVRRGIALNGAGVRRGECGFFGVSAAPHSRLHTHYEVSEGEIRQAIDRGHAMVCDAPLRIFVPHAPPYGTKVDIIHAGYHVGSTAVRDAVEELRPHLVICGHIHEGRGEDVIGDMKGRTRIVNCGMAGHGYYAIVTTPPAGESKQIDVHLHHWHKQH